MMTILQKRKRNRLRNRIWRANNRDVCCRASHNYRQNNPNKIKDYKLRVAYGISLKDYKILLKKQNGKCAICKCRETAIHNCSKRKQHLTVDHCHQSGKIRGLLCQDCNRATGLFHDDIQRLQNAIQYLSKATKKSRPSTAL